MWWENYKPRREWVCYSSWVPLRNFQVALPVSCLISFPHLVFAINNIEKAFRNCTSHNGQRLQELSRHHPNRTPMTGNGSIETQNQARRHLPLIYLFVAWSKCERLSRSQNESLSLNLAPMKRKNKSNYINSHFNKADTKVLWTVGQSTI